MRIRASKTTDARSKEAVVRKIAERFNFALVKIGEAFLMVEKTTGRLAKGFGRTPKTIFEVDKFLFKLKVEKKCDEVVTNAEKAEVEETKTAPALPAVPAEEQLSLNFQNNQPPTLTVGTKFVAYEAKIVSLENIKSIYKGNGQIFFTYVGDGKFYESFYATPEKTAALFEKLVAGIAAGEYFVKLG